MKFFNLLVNNYIHQILLITLSIGSLISCCLTEDLEFSTNELPNAILNQEYKVIVTASVNNTNADDKFDYEFSLKGKLPNGLTFTSDPENRRIIISGTPIELGIFNITLIGKISEPFDPDHYSDDPIEVIFVDIPLDITEEAVCKNHYEHEQTYTFNVLVM